MANTTVTIVGLWDGRIPSVVYNIQFDLPQGPIVARPLRHEILSIVTVLITNQDIRKKVVYEQ